MPREIDGVVHHFYNHAVVLPPAGGDLPRNEPIVVEGKNNEGVLTPRSATAPYAIITDYRTSPDGVAPACYLPARGVTYNAGAGRFGIDTTDTGTLLQEFEQRIEEFGASIQEANEGVGRARDAAESAAEAAQSTATAALTAATWERVPQNANGTWTPQQSAIPRVFVRSVAGSGYPTSATINGSTLLPGDRVEHEVDVPGGLVVL